MSAHPSGNLPAARRASKRRTTAIGAVVLEEGSAVALDIDAHLGRMVRRRRRLMGLSQVDLAQACGTGFQQIQKYECGGSRMSAARLWQIAGVLGVSLSYFFQGLPALRPFDRGLHHREESERSFAPIEPRARESE